MTRRTLPIVEATGERRAKRIAIALSVWVMTAGTCHPALQVTRAVEVPLLIRKRARAPISR